MKYLVKSNLFRAFMCLALATVVIFSSSLPASAKISGTQTWTATSDQSDVFTVTNDNLSPYKTLAFNGSLDMWITFSQADTSSSPIKVRFEIRNLTTGLTHFRNLKGSWGNVRNHIYVPAHYGDIIQIYVDVSTADGYPLPGYYRSARVQYGYQLT